VTGRALVVRGDALQLPLPDGCVDLIVTSPPYWALRDYQTPGQLGSEPTPQEFLANLWAATAEMVRVLKPTGSIFVDLGDKYAGSAGGSSNGGDSSTLRGTGHVGGGPSKAALRALGRGPLLRTDTPAKSLMLLPERYRVGCVDQLGLIARAVIVWFKPNGLPESVRDRVKRSHEDWVHLVKQPRYYTAIDEVREPQNPNTHARGKNGATERDGESLPTWGIAGTQSLRGIDKRYVKDSLGKLPGSVWSVPSEPLDLPGYFAFRDGQMVAFLAPKRGGVRARPNGHHPGLFDLDPYREVVASGDGPAWRWLRANAVTSSPWPQTDAGLQLRTAASHYAAFPSAWPRQLILGWSPPGICVECGQGRVPVVDKQHEDMGAKRGANSRRAPRDDGSDSNLRGINALDARKTRESATILGYACSCGSIVAGGQTGSVTGLGLVPTVGSPLASATSGTPLPPTRPALVLDPFGGTGTTAMVARALGRDAITVDLSHDYSRAARWRIFQSGNAGKALARTNRERQGTLT
jgi:SAM-dependent methyltransferase